MDDMGTAMRRVTRNLPPFPELDFRDPDYVERFLVDLPTTDWQQNQAAATAADLAQALEDQRPMLADRLRRKHRTDERLLERCHQRDTLQAERPEGCWCLGLGGKARVAIPRYLPSERSGREHNEGYLVWSAYCDCADGQRIEAEQEEQLRTIKRRRIQDRLERLFGSLPAHFRDLTLASYPWGSVSPSDLRRRLLAWPKTNAWLFLHGPVGLGKTALAIALLRAEIEAGRTGLYRTVPRLLDQIKETYSNRDQATADESQILAALYTCDVLVLDDMGKEQVTDWVRPLLFKIVDARYTEGKRTIVTSNMSLPDLAAHLNDPAALDRIRELAGPDYTITMAGASLRGRRAA